MYMTVKKKKKKLTQDEASMQHRHYLEWHAFEQE